MQTLTDFHMMSLLLFLAVSLSSATVSLAMPEDEELSPEHKACLLECLRCEEVWGDNYDATICADNCLLTNGASIDQDCTLGVEMGKRNYQISSLCQGLCVKCAELKPGYDMSSCQGACKSGSVADYYCTKHNRLFRQKH